MARRSWLRSKSLRDALSDDLKAEKQKIVKMRDSTQKVVDSLEARQIRFVRAPSSEFRQVGKAEKQVDSAKKVLDDYKQFLVRSNLTKAS